jgi:magnesium-transporting ATPase (P-type)
MVQVGQGKGIVVSTGDLTEIGKIGSLVSQQKTVKTNLIIQLEIFGRYISAFIIVVSLVTFCLAYLKAQVPAGEAFNSATAIAVAMIPEGLPAVVTISLALATQILVKNNAIVKQLPAIETLGSVSVICSDKTGTLTKNEMTVTKIFTLAANYRVHGVGYSPDQGYLVGADGVEISADSKAKLLHMFGGIVLCNDAEFRISKSEGGGMECAAVGYPTEVALLVLGMKLGIRDLARFRESRQRLATVPFSSELKFMCTIHKEGPKAILHIKGAPENIFLR